MLFLLLLVTNFRYEGRAVPDLDFLAFVNFMSRTRSLVVYSLLTVIDEACVPSKVVKESATVVVTTVLLHSFTVTTPSERLGDTTLVTVVVVVVQDRQTFAEEDTTIDVCLEDPPPPTATVFDVDTVEVVVVTSVTTVFILASPLTTSAGKPFCSAESLLKLDSSPEMTGDNIL